MKKISILILAIIGFFRFYDLEKDPPAYNISGITIADEPYYCYSGLEKYLKDNKRLEEKLQISPPGFFADHNLILTYLSLKIFGCNYNGLRVGVVLLSLLIIIMLFYLFRNSAYYNSSYSWLFLVFIGFDFYFFLFSRYQSPQLYSIFWLTFSLFLVSLSEKQKLFIIPAAFTLFLSSTWVYPYTAFASIGFAVWIFYESINTRSLKPFYFSVSGVIFGVLFLIFSFWLDNKTIHDCINSMANFNNSKPQVINLISIKELIFNFLQIPYTNLLRFNPFLFLVLMLGIFYSVLNFKKASAVVKLSFFCILSAFLQSLLTNSHPFKKWIIIYPFIITLGPMVYHHIVTTFHSKYEKFLLSVLSLIVMIVGVNVIRVNNLNLYWGTLTDLVILEFLPSLFQWILYISLIIICVSSIILFYYDSYWIKIIFTLSIFIPLFSLHIFYLLNTEHTYKNTLQEIGQRIGSNLITGDFSHAYVYYNSATPSYNPYVAKYLSSSYDERFEKKIREIDKPLVYISENLTGKPLPLEIYRFNKKFRYVCGNRFWLYSEISEK